MSKTRILSLVYSAATLATLLLAAGARWRPNH
jgi:hypothetical protein